MSIPAETQKMMRLLSQVILADDHIYATEIQALALGAVQLDLKDEAGHVLTEAITRQWFEDYLQELNTTWSTTPKDIVLTQLILSLAEWPDKQSVVDVLENISLADANLHREEKLLISIVKAYWQYDGLDAPGARIEV